MNLILVREEDFIETNQVRLQGERAKHIKEIHRAVPGDSLRVGLVGGPMGQGKVVSLTTGEVVLSVSLQDCPPLPIAVDLLLAMPRPKILKKLLWTVASMGVKRIVLVNSYRVEKSYFDSPLLEPAAIEEELCIGLSQAKDTILPQVVVRKLFRPFVEDELPTFWPQPTRRLLAHPDANQDLWGVASVPTKDPVVVAIGPEGGWIQFEVELLESLGFQRFTAGPRILRVDTAIPYLVGQLELLSRRSLY